MLRRKPAEDRKADIVAAVLALADRIGPDRLTTNDIAHEVGVTQAAIFRHFPTKADVWTAVGDAIADRLESAWQVAANSSESPLERLRALIAAQLRQIEQTPALPAILHSRELNMDNAALRERFRGVLMQYQAYLVANLEAMADADLIGAGVHPKDAAVLLTSLVQGIAIRWSLGSRSFAIVPEGLRLLEVQLVLFACKEERK
jgi:TetR/AcrR family transcriptional regulator